jgi:hypothetical protein
MQKNIYIPPLGLEKSLLNFSPATQALSDTL